MRTAEFERDFKMQIARELCVILDGLPRQVAAASIETLGSRLLRPARGS